MSFRTRLFLAFLMVLLVPLGVLAIGVRGEMERRVSAEYRERVRSLAALVRLDLSRESDQLGRLLAALGEELAGDNRFRAAAVQDDPGTRTWLLDWAGDVRRTAGLDYLRLQDSAGRVLSSGHFRNEFDRVEPELAGLLTNAAGGAPALLRARTAEGELLVVARADSFRVAKRLYRLVGGRSLDAAALAPAAQARGLAVEIRLPGAPPARGDTLGVADAFSLPLVDAREGRAATDSARVVVTQSLAPLEALRRGVDTWFLGALVFTAAAAILAALWLSSRVSRPLRDLAEKTSRLDLDRLDVGFGSERRDEIGTLARLLDAMAGRLRESAGRLREAERRATVGDLARQVNHDVRNGLQPIRHVLAHFDEVANRDPAELARVFAERRATLESSVAYLETLARNYARLTPGRGEGACDVNAIAREVAAGSAGRAEVRLDLAPGLPPAQADPILVRRVVENLVRNAIESLNGQFGGGVTVATAPAGTGGVQITVTDTGRGMSQAELDRAFEGFYSTKAGGTGLGLTIVRRLVQDVGGRLRVESEPGCGSRFLVEFPAAGAA